MSTHDLIQAALDAQTAFDAAQATMKSASQALQQAQANLTAANQALHDDLAANGPAAIVDETTTPATVTMYTAVDPDSWQATEIRVAA
jgi:hypothetical protein